MRLKILRGVLALAALAAFLTIPAQSHAALPCTDAHVANAADIQAGYPAGAMVCPGDQSKTGVTEQSGSAKQYLESLPRTGSATDNSNIEKLNSAMAICAANFLKAFQQQHGGVTITAAYRSPEYDAKMCVNNSACGALMNNPNPNGNHQKGLAMDVQASAGQAAIAQFAQQNPQLGVCFPFSSAYGSSFKDDVHMILAGIPGSEPSGPGCSQVKQPCSGSGFDPNSIANPPTTQNNGTPFNQQVRQALGQPPPPPQPPQQPAPQSPVQQITPPPTAPTTPTQSCSQQNYCASDGNIHVYNSSCTDQVVQTCQYGCTGTICNPSPGTGLSTTTTGIPYQNLPLPESSSTNDLIDQYAGFTETATDIATATPIDVNQLLEDLAGGTSSLAPSSPTTTNASGTLVAQAPMAQQTFTSSDLSNSPGVTTQSVTGLGGILFNIQQVLQQVLVYLQPFGSSSVVATVAPARLSETSY